MGSRPFIKMHGLGNDFVVIDARDRPLALSNAEAQAIADRHSGVGCDQLLILEKPAKPNLADVFMRILNADGSEAGACGNGTRCVADLLMRESGRDKLVIETTAGLLDAERAAGGRVSVDMGPARLDWREIPLEGGLRHQPRAAGARPAQGPGRRSTWATRTPSSSSTTRRRSTSRRSAPSSSTMRCFPSAPISASRR